MSKSKPRSSLQASISDENLTVDAIAPLTPEEIEELKRAFRLFDRDSGGTISKQELGDVLRSMGNHVTDKVLDDMFKEVDADGNGTIDLGEFLALMKCWSRCVVSLRSRLGGFRQHCACCLFFCTIDAVACFALWSEMGWGTQCLDALEDMRDEMWPMMSLGTSLMLLLLLYIFDFFLPPHLPGRMLLLSEKYPIIGRLFFAAAMILGFCGSLPIAAYESPHRPLLMTIYLAPVCVIIVGISVRYYHFFLQTVMKLAIEATGSTLELELFLIVKDIALEDDDGNYYKGAMTAFFVTGLACLAAWVPWAAVAETRLPSNDASDGSILWASPAIVGVAMLTFGAMVSVRVQVHGAYTSIGRQLELVRSSGGSKSVELGISHSLSIATESREQKTINQMKRFLKIIVAVCLIVFACAVAVSSLAFQRNHIAKTIRDLLSSFCFSFVVFLVLAFSRLVAKMREGLKETPYWKPLMVLTSSDWARAMAVCAIGPVIIAIFLLSMVSQRLRRMRGLQLLRANSLDSLSSEDSTTHGSEMPSWLNCLTLRIRRRALRTRHWDWICICVKANILCAVAIALFLCPLVINIFFAFVIDLLRPLRVFWTVLLVFVLGIASLLIPTVPTTTIYVFGGVVMARKWMSLPSHYGGYWGGVGCCVILSLCLKLFGRILQYQCFGRMFGRKLWVQQLCKVHTPLMRCVASMMTESGICKPGKVAVLCGMPDWPMGVGAGILGLPLPQVLIGTVPIVIFIGPCVLFGALYIRKEEGDSWKKAFTGAMVAIAAISTLFQVLAALSVQRTFGRHMEELSRPDPKYVELYWLDHCAAALRQYRHINWHEVPRCLRVLGVSSSVAQVCILHIFFWSWELCFGRFVVTDDIKKLKWHGEDGVIRLLGYGCLVVLAVSYVSAITLHRWVQHRQRSVCADALAELRGRKDIWIQQWHAQVEQVEKTDSGSEPRSPAESTDVVVLCSPSPRSKCSAEPGSPPVDASPRQKVSDSPQLESVLDDLPVDVTPRQLPCATPMVATLWGALSLFGAPSSPRQIDCANI